MSLSPSSCGRRFYDKFSEGTARQVALADTSTTDAYMHTYMHTVNHAICAPSSKGVTKISPKDHES